MSFDRAKKKFLQEKYRFNSGYSEFSWIKGTGGFFMLAYLTVKQSGYPIPTWLIVIAGLLVLVGFWVVGYIWDKAHMNHISAEVGNERNYFVKDVREALKTRKRKL